MWKIVKNNTFSRCKTCPEFKQFSYWVTSLFARFICLVFLGLCSTDFFRSQFSQSSEGSLWKKGKRKSKASKDTCKLFIVNLQARNVREILLNQFLILMKNQAVSWYRVNFFLLKVEFLSGTKKPTQGECWNLFLRWSIVVSDSHL